MVVKMSEELSKAKAQISLLQAKLKEQQDKKVDEKNEEKKNLERIRELESHIVVLGKELKQKEEAVLKPQEQSSRPGSSMQAMNLQQELEATRSELCSIRAEFRESRREDLKAKNDAMQRLHRAQIELKEERKRTETLQVEKEKAESARKASAALAEEFRTNMEETKKELE